MKKTLATLTSAVLLAACGGEDSGSTNTDTWNAGSQSLVYSYPAKGQTEIATPAPVILRFTSAVNSSSAQSHITLHEGNRNGTSLSYTLREIDNGRGLVLTPDTRLTPLSRYTVVVDGLPLVDGDTDSHVFSFTTRALEEGPRSQVLASSDFALSRLVPDGQALPVMDFSTLRLQFSQPLDPASVQYGNDSTDTLTLSGPGGELVEARVLVDGPYLTLDPTSDLTPGQNYTLTLASGLASTAGNALAADSYTLTPKDSRPREVMVQKVSDSANRALLSPLTGLPINEVPINATLLGDDNATQQGGDVHAELAFVPNYPEVTPFTVPRSTVLAGSSIDVNIGGEVPAGFSTGAVNVHFLSDASGYLLPNPYTQRADAPRQVRLFMDVAMSTEDPTANGGVTQDILHIELVGTALVVDGIMTIDAVSMVEPNILGLERGYGTLSFHMEAYRDQLNPPEQVADTTPPELQSWQPGGNGTLQKPDAPVILNFSEPLNSDTLDGNITLLENGSEIDSQWYQNGAAVVIKPDTPLQRDNDQMSFSYEVQLGTEITDLAGNLLVPPSLTPFKLTQIVQQRTNPFTGMLEPVEQRSPIVLATIPGFPCALDPATRDLANNDAGRCLGGFPGIDTGSAYDIKPEDDHIPVTQLSANRPIVVEFSRPIDPQSVVLGSSFIVEEINQSGATLASVDGDIRLEGQRLTFWPESPWQPGSLYRYTLGSNGDSMSAQAQCDGSESICDMNGLPLQTNVLGSVEIKPVTAPQAGALFPPEREYQVIKSAIASNGGGPAMVQYFRGGSSTEDVLQMLSNQPSYDSNANFVHDINEVVSDGPDFFAIPLYTDYQYPFEEPSAAGQPLDPEADQELDPNGVLPPPNSAKVLSRRFNGNTPLEQPVPVINGANVGCGYAEAVPYDPPFDFFVYGVPMECPEQKFTYLTGALAAEVTQEYVDGQGLKVKIWPGQIMSTGLKIRQRLLNVSNLIKAYSGAQLLRMRYEEDENGDRTQPITGWIHEVDGKPYLSATVDLYMEGLELKEALNFTDPTHNLLSYPITMNLSGEVKFLADGRMVIEQYNLEPVDLNIRVQINDGSYAGEILLTIPAHGNYLQYVSDPIK